ncbi:MAG: GGDEF domain-containing protein, partial [Clostridia bacterium]|nr:GGDEF domain-containing protein [Clostridia bacterium]
LACAFDILGRIFEGLPGPTALMMNQWGNVLLYAVNLVPLAVWLFYTQSLTFSQSRLFQVSVILVHLVLVINAVIAVLSLRTGWYFTVSPDNVYVRGPLFPLHMGFALAIVVLSISLILIYHRQLRPHMIALLLGYYVLPVLGAVLQARFYGVSLIWPMTSISILFIYQHIIDHHLTTDYLTGTVNRRHFEKILMKKLTQVRPDHCLALIAADIDRFKQINDQHGHSVGDQALQTAVHVLRQCLRPEDVIARVGGDEFYIILHSRNTINLDQTILRFQQAFNQLNLSGAHPYTLNLSYGGAIFCKADHATAQSLLEQADSRMYENKPASKQKQALAV